MNFFKQKRVILLYVSTSSLVVGISYYININIRSKLSTIALSESFFWLTVPVLFFSLISLFIKYDVFKIWVKFTIPYFIVSSIIIFIAPVSTHGMDIYPATKENLTIVLASVYSLVSLILIIYKSLKKDNS